MTYLGTIKDTRNGNRIDGYLVRPNAVELRATFQNGSRFGISYVTLPEWEEMLMIDQSHQAYRQFTGNSVNRPHAIALA